MHSEFLSMQEVPNKYVVCLHRISLLILRSSTSDVPSALPPTKILLNIQISLECTSTNSQCQIELIALYCSFDCHMIII